MKSNNSIPRNFILNKFHFLQFQKWPKINFTKEIFDIIWFHEFFCLDFFKFSGPLWHDPVFLEWTSPIFLRLHITFLLPIGLIISHIITITEGSIIDFGSILLNLLSLVSFLLNLVHHKAIIQRGSSFWQTFASTCVWWRRTTSITRWTSSRSNDDAISMLVVFPCGTRATAAAAVPSSSTASIVTILGITGCVSLGMVGATTTNLNSCRGSSF